MSRQRNRKVAALLALAFIAPTMFGTSGSLSRQQDKPVTSAPGHVVVNPPPNEVRALWVVRTTLTSPEKIRTMVQSAKDNGFNTLIVQVRGRGDSYYHSRW